MGRYIAEPFVLPLMALRNVDDGATQSLYNTKVLDPVSLPATECIDSLTLPELKFEANSSRRSINSFVLEREHALRFNLLRACSGYTRQSMLRINEQVS